MKVLFFPEGYFHSWYEIKVLEARSTRCALKLVYCSHLKQLGGLVY